MTTTGPTDVPPSPNANNTFIGLMNHLQTMELQLTSVLMEATMKIAAMIDANVFIMVESSGQRYFSGRKYLIESYLNNCLGPSSNDVQLEIYPEVCALQEKSPNPNHHSGGDGPGPNHHHSPHGSQPAYPTSPGNASHHHPHHDQHHRSTPHHMQQTQHHPDPHSQHHAPHRPQSQHQHESPRRSRKRSSPATSSHYSVDYGNVQMRFKSGSSTPKKLRTEIAASLKLEADGTGESDDVAVIDEDGAEEGEEQFAGDGSSYQIENGEVPTNEHMTVLSAILAHPKLEAVQQVCDSSIADKDSVASKLLNSLLYEYAKIAAHHCPFDTVDDPRCKAFYSRCFEELWTHLPNLQELHDKGLKTCIGKRARPLKSGCREKYRTVFAHTKKSPYPIKYKTLEWNASDSSGRETISGPAVGGGGGGGGGGGVSAAARNDGMGIGAAIQRQDGSVGGMGDPAMRMGLDLNNHN